MVATPERNITMIEIELKDDEISAALDRVARNLTDMSPLMNSIGELVEFQTEQRFEEGVSPEGVPWAPKSEATRAAYERRGVAVDYRPLFGPNVDGEPLRKSFSRSYGPDFVEVGTNKIYSAVMQFGAKQGAFGADAAGHPVPWGNIPARPYLGISEENRTQILEEIDEWLARAASGD